MPPSGKPRWAASYSMSLQRAFLHPRTRPSFSMSLRTSAHTGVAIRSPAAVQNEKLYFGQIRKVLRICPNSLPTGQVSLRGYGLPRRFAPRNDMLKVVTRLRLQGRGARKVCGTRSRVSVCNCVPPGHCRKSGPCPGGRLRFICRKSGGRPA